MIACGSVVGHAAMLFKKHSGGFVYDYSAFVLCIPCST